MLAQGAPFLDTRPVNGLGICSYSNPVQDFPWPWQTLHVRGFFVSPFIVVFLGCLPLFQHPCKDLNRLIKGGLIRSLSNVIKTEFTQEESLGNKGLSL